MDVIAGFFSGHLAEAFFTGILIGLLTWSVSKPKLPDNKRMHAAIGIINSIRGPLTIIAAVLGAILYMLQVPYR